MVDSNLRDVPPGEIRAGHHIGHFYRDIEELAPAACRYITEGLQRGESVIVVATRRLWAAIMGKLALKNGIDLSEAVMNGQLRHMDADVVLSALLERGMPDGHRFHEQAGALIERALKRFGAVRVLAELAGMLWQQGNEEAAIRLEELWNGLAKQLPFTLLCPYRTDSSGAEGYNLRLKSVCSAHSCLLPIGKS